MTGGLVEPQSQAWWWNLACEAARWMREGNVLAPMTLEGPIMASGEAGRMTAPSMRYHRLYGGSGNYQAANPFVAGSTSFVVGVWSAALLVNQHRRSQAEQDARVVWRDHGDVVVHVTSQRLITTRPEGSLEFAYSRVKAFEIDLDIGAIALEFTGDVAPLRLSGSTVPMVALMMAHDLLGSNWVNDSRLARLC